MPIRQLPTLVINQIAAGEVIERPASVVKELVENALDAGATHIDIAIEEGGAKLIRISDDGIGIPEDELTLAVAPHATSKIKSADELEAIGTLGFRGEALASIASISRLRITSRPRNHDGSIEEAAGVLEVDGGEVKGPFPGASKPGTVIEVKDLFFNTPARRKFMRSPGSEFGHINDTVQKIAMVNADCGFTLTHNGRKVQDLPRNQSRKERCVALMGKDIQDALLEFERVDDPNRGSAKVWGLAGMPSLGRATTKFQHVCVNGRPVKDRNLQHAIKEAYRGLMAPDRFPQIVAFIDMDPSQVDVNVHPQKSEVRFRNPSHLHGLVLTALRQRLLGADLTPSVGFRERGFGSSGLGVGEGSQGSTALLPPSTASGDSPPNPNPQIPNPSSFVDYFRKMDPTQKGFVYQEVKKQLAEEAPDEVTAEDDAFEQQLLSRQAAAAPNSQPQTPNSTTILQIHDSYVVTQDAHGLVIIDQHALHERVMFEKLRARILDDKESLESQRLLVPDVVRADAARQAALEDLQPLLHRLGIEASPIGPAEVAVHAFPSLLFSRNVKVAPFMEELLDKADAGAFDKIELGDGTDAQLPEEQALHEVLDMMSCKAAIKAGDKMSEQELASLLKQRDAIERSSNCPHGRPTTLRLTLKDLERQFGRS